MEYAFYKIRAPYCTFNGELTTTEPGIYQVSATCNIAGLPQQQGLLTINVASGSWGPCAAGYRFDLNSVACVQWDASICTETGVANGTPDYCGVSDPISHGTGGKFHVETDYVGTGVFPITFKRYYNSPLGDPLGDSPSFLAHGWRHSYDGRLFPIAGGSGISTVYAIRPDGKWIRFQADPFGQWQPAVPLALRLIARMGIGGSITGWSLVDLDDTTENYTVDGLLSEIRDRHGNAQRLTYDASGTLIGIDDDFGRSVTLSYGPDPRLGVMLTNLAFSTGESISYGRHNGSDPATDPSYDTVTYQDLTSRRYIYDESGRNPAPNTYRWALTGIVDENGSRYASFAYDTDSRAIAGVVGDGLVPHSISYQPAGIRIVTDPLGTQRTYQFQSNAGRILQGQLSQPCSSGCGNSSATTYDATGNPQSSIDFSGNRTNYVYDTTRNLETQRTEGLTFSGAATPQSRTISTQWHGNFRLPAVVAEPLRITSYVYNGDGGVSCGTSADGVTPVPGVLCAKTIQPTMDASGSAGFAAVPAGAPRTWRYTYNANGSVLSMDGPRVDVADVTAYAYYASNDVDPGRRGNIATVVNALGHTTRILAYTAYGQATTIVDPNGLVTTLTYDARHRLTSRNVGGEVTIYSYDNVGQLPG